MAKFNMLLTITVEAQDMEEAHKLMHHIAELIQLWGAVAPVDARIKNAVVGADINDLASIFGERQT